MSNITVNANIKLILFDLGGVLIELGSQLFPRMWLPKDQNFSLVEWFSSETAGLFETGQISSNEFLRRLKSDLNLQASLPQIEQAFTDWLQGLYPGTHELLSRLKENYQLAVLSNTNELHEPIILNELGLKDKFAHIYLSHKIGLAKPNPAVFKHVTESLGLAPDEIVFFDDNAANVHSAERLGFQAFQVFGPCDVAKYV